MRAFGLAGGVTLSVLSVLAADAARACSRELPRLDMPSTRVPFEGRAIPRNAELRIALQRDDGSTLTIERPDGTSIAARLEFDDVSAFVAHDDTLEPGAHTLVIALPPQEERRVAFEVVDIVDDEPPDAPAVSISRRTVGDLDGNSCQPSWPTDEVHILVSSDSDDAALATVDGSFMSTFGGNGVAGVILFETRGGDVTYGAVVRDHAGNVSETTTATAWAGCDGGCSSAGGAAPWLGALMLFGMLRGRSRRQRTTCAFE